MTDPIADMLTRIRNAVLVHRASVDIPFSKLKLAIGKILEREGFVQRVEHVAETESARAVLRLTLKYRDREPAIRGIQRISRSGQRVYRGYQDIPKVLPSLGMLIISTPRGLLTNSQARQHKLGGEVLCEVF
ncbi:MAG: 30S ribosomal protein S8 [Patescibacteria group bacterium]